jgi:Cu+-exporting ATPase
LERVKGVQSAEVDFAAGLASVRGDAPVEALAKAVEQAGYRAEAVESFEDPRLLRAEVEKRQQLQWKSWRWRALVGIGRDDDARLAFTAWRRAGHGAS